MVSTQVLIKRSWILSGLSFCLTIALLIFGAALAYYPYTMAAVYWAAALSSGLAIALLNALFAATLSTPWVTNRVSERIISRWAKYFYLALSILVILILLRAVFAPRHFVIRFDGETYRIPRGSNPSGLTSALVVSNACVEKLINIERRMDERCRIRQFKLESQSGMGRAAVRIFHKYDAISYKEGRVVFEDDPTRYSVSSPNSSGFYALPDSGTWVEGAYF